jgi:signal peptidase II
MTSSPSSLFSRLWPWLLIAAAVVGLDQLSKYLILQRFTAEGQGVTITSFFNLMRHHNPGAAFSFLAGESGWQRWLFVGIAFGATGFILWMLKNHSGQKMFAWALALILGGAVGNVIDRLLHGYVVDFIQLHAAGREFPTFNIADSAITLGAVLLILDELLRVRKAAK